MRSLAKEANVPSSTHPIYGRLGTKTSKCLGSCRDRIRMILRAGFASYGHEQGSLHRVQGLKLVFRHLRNSAQPKSNLLDCICFAAGLLES